MLPLRRTRTICVALASVTLLTAADAPSTPDTLSYVPTIAEPIWVKTSPAPAYSTVKLAPFAAELAERPMVTGPDGWPIIKHVDAWQQIGNSTPLTRQAARWALALSLVGQAGTESHDDFGGHASDAMGVLDSMRRDDPDLMLVPVFRLAAGLALARLGQGQEALTMLTDPMLIANPEACMWRMVALEQMGKHEQAIGQVGCARTAIAGRKLPQVREVIFSAVRAALATRRPRTALNWLLQFPDNDSGANLMRGKAFLQGGKAEEGKLRLERVLMSGTVPERTDAELTLLEYQVAHGEGDMRATLKALNRLRLVWRGDEIEERTLRLGYRVAQLTQDNSASLSFGAALLRYFEDGEGAAAMLASCQQQLQAALADNSKMPLANAVGLFWDYRDLAPTGSQGDALLQLLARRLADARLFERAGDLLAYQMSARAKDVQKGPLSIQAAQYFILSGKPSRAIQVLRDSDEPAYPSDMLDSRHRLEAVSLYQLGQIGQALGILEDVPGTEGLRAEMLWRRRDWQGLVARLGGVGGGRNLSSAQQAIVLRQAVALNMLGKEAELAKLRSRYGAAFAASPSAAAFHLLTGPLSAMTPDGIAAAMAAIPTASVAGEYEVLLDARPNETPKLASAVN